MELFLFSSDPGDAKEASEAGIDGFVIDWEFRGKHRRQRERDTEINRDTPKSLAQMAAVQDSRRICRLNGFGQWTRQEVETAIDLGATDLLLPMVTRVEDVEQYLEWVGGRIRAGILVETEEACELACQIAKFPLDLVYIGLNDLAISRGTASIFRPLVDGLAMRVRNEFENVPVGMGGLTVVDGGSPLPSIELMAELARHRCDFTFLRRSFRRDIVGRALRREVSRIHRAWFDLAARDDLEGDRDHDRFVAIHADYERSL